MNESDLRMVILWESGRDTRDIADAMRMRESDVYNCLPSIRQRCREDRQRGTPPA